MGVTKKKGKLELHLLARQVDGAISDKGRGRGFEKVVQGGVCGETIKKIFCFFPS